MKLFDYQKEVISSFREHPINLSYVVTGKYFMAIGSV